MVRLLVEEARHALPLPNPAQCKRDARPISSTSTHAPSRAAGSFFDPIPAIVSSLVRVTTISLIVPIIDTFATKYR